MRRVAAAAVLALALGAACERTPVDPTAPTDDTPGALDARYEWAVDGWIGRRPVGTPTVVLTWLAPNVWQNQPFRVYGRRSGTGDYVLLATVTSCAERECRYVDANLAPDRSYDYFVAVFDESTGRERSSTAVSVDVPAYQQPQTPSAPSVVPLDELVYLTWPEAQPSGGLWKYMVFLERMTQPAAATEDSVFVQIGEADGNGFLDLLADNGAGYRYSIATVDLDGHVSERSALSAAAFPRPDALGQLIYAHADDAERSGFAFLTTTGEPIVPGTSAAAHWRLVVEDGEWYIEPLGGTAVTSGVATSALVCGPGADAGCTSLDRAPETGYATTRVALENTHTYVFRVPGTPEARFGKIRVTLLGTDQAGRRLMLFDWAYQLRPGERDLSITPAQ